MKKKKERSTGSWVLEFAGQKKSMYIYSVIMALKEDDSERVKE
jgi:hypothetical protein